MRNSPRLCMSVAALALLFPLALSLPSKPAYAADNQVTFIFGGDVEWSLNARPPTVRYRIAGRAANPSAAEARPDLPWR